MGKTGDDADASPVTMGKNKISDLPDIDGNGNGLVEIDEALPKEKRESESNEDGVEDRPDKGNLVDDADLGEKKQTESGSNEDGVEDQRHKSELLNDGDVSKNGKKKKRKRDSSEETRIEENEDDQNDGPQLSIEDSLSEKSDAKKRKLDAQNPDTEMEEIMAEASTPETQGDTKDSKGTKEKKKTKAKASKAQNKTIEPVENNTGKATAKGKNKSKKVSPSGHVEGFPSSDTGPKNQTTKGDGLIRGKRFTPEEDEIIKDAVNNYITDNNLGDDGLMMVLNCQANHITKCWQEIGKCIPYRPHTAVYSRAHVLFERSEAKGFTPEEEESLRKYVQKYGNNWKKIGELMGKSRLHVKDTWRRIKPVNPKAGKWAQEEIQTVYDLVNTDLKMRVHCEKKSKHGMLKDNIPWGAISEKLSTRSDAGCCTKWYKLTSSLVAEKLWSDADDYRMIGKLYELDAACVDDVDWDNLLEHRPGDICRKRWNQMVKHIGDYGSKPFSEQVDVLAERYLPDLAETREAWDKKPYVP